jgi:type IV fimbrial biogenesis protein FimT
MKQQRGFSIIELAVTLVVLGLLITSALPNISSWMRNTKLRNQTESLLAGLQQARNEAVRGNRAMTFWMVNLPTANSLDNTCALSAAGTSWVVSVGSPEGKCDIAPSASTAPQIVTARVGSDGSSGVSVNGLKADGTTAASSVTFDGFGRATSGLQIIDVKFATANADDRPLRIEISTSGLTRMCDTKVTTAGDPRKCVTTTAGATYQ